MPVTHVGYMCQDAPAVHACCTYQEALMPDVVQLPRAAGLVDALHSNSIIPRTLTHVCLNTQSNAASQLEAQRLRNFVVQCNQPQFGIRQCSSCVTAMTAQCRVYYAKSALSPPAESAYVTT